MRTTYLVANVFWLVLAASAAAEAWRLNVGGLHTPGPGFLPFYAALLLGGLALVALVQDFKEASGPASTIWGDMRMGKMIAMLASLFLYVFFLERLGFLVATFLLLLVLFRLLEPYRWTTVLLLSLVTMGAAYLFFVVLLDSRLPVGVFGI
ncbi:MAG TPA: tripartite tricarboxylate transporter TctB family protein [Candidatus Sulfotelmatobacter sp.]|nr:tripartite tricarboxylate transporter TctB family protein [Candidatus Sulfotelmatobacter sp.]